MSISKLCRHWTILVVLSTQLFAVASVVAETNPRPSQSTSPGLQIETVAERRLVTASSEGAQVEFVPAEQLHICDEIFYTVRVRNVSDADIDGAIVIKAMPHNTRYVPDSAFGPAAAIGFSIDGGTTFGTADELNIATLPGVTRRATADDYTHIRWQLRHPLAAGATALLRFRGIFR
jgi:uncharacterized repeat protein (TIGR01451 family)